MVSHSPKRRGYLSLGSGRAICQLCGEKIANGVPQINHRANRCTASFHANAKDCGVPRSKKYIKEAGCSNCGMVLIAERGNCLNCFTMNAESFEASDGWVRSHSKGDLAWDVSGLITFIREKPFHFEKQFTMPPYPNTLEIIVDGFFTGISYEDLDPEDFNASLRKQYVSYWTDEKLEEMLESSTMELVKVFYEEIADEEYFGDTDEEEFPECDWCGHEECICEEEDKAKKEKYIMKEKAEHEKWKQEHIEYCDGYFVKQMKRYMKANQNTWFLEDVITDEPMLIPTYIRFSDKTIGKTIYEYKLDYEGVYGAETFEAKGEELFDCVACDKTLYENDDPQDDELCNDCLNTHKQCSVCQDYEPYNEMTSCFTCGQNYCGACDKYDSCEEYDAETFKANSEGNESNWKKVVAEWDGLPAFLRTKPFRFEKQFTMSPHPNELKVNVEGYFMQQFSEQYVEEGKNWYETPEFQKELKKFVGIYTDERLQEILEKYTIDKIKRDYEDVRFADDEDEIEDADDYFKRQMDVYMEDWGNMWMAEKNIDNINPFPVFYPTHVKFVDEKRGFTIYEFKDTLPQEYRDKFGAETFEAREDLTCDYCDKIILPNCGLTLCDDCFDDAIKNAESSNTKLLGIGAGILATIFYMYFQK